MGQGLLAYDELIGIDWKWLSMHGAMTKAPLGGKKVGPNPTDRGKRGVKRSLLVERQGVTSSPMFIVAERKPEHVASTVASLGGGWSSSRIVGSTAPDGSSCDGRSEHRPTSECCTWCAD